MNFKRYRPLIIAAVLFALGNRIYSDTVVVPNSAENVDRVGGAAIPFAGDGERRQYLYSSLDLITAMPNGGYITGLAYRNDAEFGAPVDTVVPDIEIYMSTTAASPPSSMSPVFAENIGPDYQVVFQRGSVPVKASYIPGSVHPFELSIPFTNPFFYNPRNGNILVDTFVHKRNPGPAIIVDVAPANRAIGTSGGPIGGAPAIQFTFFPIPEPNMLGISILLGGIIVVLRSRK